MTASEKRAAGPIVRPEIEAILKADLALAGMTDPNNARRTISHAKAQAALYRCYDPERGGELDERVHEWAQRTEDAIAEELKCRASDVCQAQRIADAACAALADRRDAQQQIALERRSPGGVVNLQLLHDLGERVQADDATITTSKADYATLAKKPFTSALCK
ncbi:MAG: hypothetical protein HOO96_04425 [Polyangiaceae bacterium]|nr:hypothetical protein [Polyangiaceae bacterium]